MMRSHGFGPNRPKSEVHLSPAFFGGNAAIRMVIGRGGAWTTALTDRFVTVLNSGAEQRYGNISSVFAVNVHVDEYTGETSREIHRCVCPAHRELHRNEHMLKGEHTWSIA